MVESFDEFTESIEEGVIELDFPVLRLCYVIKIGWTFMPNLKPGFRWVARLAHL